MLLGNEFDLRADLKDCCATLEELNGVQIIHIDSCSTTKPEALLGVVSRTCSATINGNGGMLAPLTCIFIEQHRQPTSSLNIYQGLNFGRS